MFFFFETSEPNPPCLVIGVGGGGCKALEHLYKTSNNQSNIDYLAIDTDSISINHLNIPLNKKLIIGERHTDGKGAYANPQKGEQSAVESTTFLKKFISKVDYKLIFVLAGMGGGTGSGASPIIAQLCKETSALVISVLSIPFNFEGQLRLQHAKKGISRLKEYSDSVLLFSNEDLVLDKSNYNVSINETFQYSDAIFKTPIEIILGIINTQGHINLDLFDVRTIMKSSGLSSVTSGTGKGKRRVDRALNNLFQSPYFLNFGLESVNRLLFNIYSGENQPLIVEEMDAVSLFINKFNSDIEIIWGTATDTSITDDEIKISAIFSGNFKDNIMEFDSIEENIPTSSIPANIEKDVLKIRMDNKARKIGFLIMQFGRGKFYDEILDILRKSLLKYNIVVLRADDKEYNEDLYFNILSYIYASDFGIALFERIQDESFNPNVAFEVGYMYGIGKPICFMKEKSLRQLHTDIIGKLYREFDIQDIERTLVPSIKAWLKDKNII